jgi:hypothetical protein
MRIHKLLLAGFATLLGALALNAAPAGAVIGYVNLCPSLATEFCMAKTETEINGVAVDNSGGSSANDVWVLYEDRHEGNLERLLKFDAAGKLLAEVGEANLPASAQPISGGNNVFWDVVVDPANGDIYASDGDSNVHAGTVTKFSSSGVFQFQLTAGSCVPALSGCATPQKTLYPQAMAIDPSNGDLYVADLKSNVIDKFTSSGIYVEQFQVTESASLHGEGITDIAADSNGHIFVANKTGEPTGEPGTGPQVREYTSTGAPVDCPGADNVLYEATPEPGGVRTAGPLAVDPSDGHIFIGEHSASEGFFIAEYSAPCEPPTVGFGGKEFGGLSGFGEEGGLQGIGVSASTHEVYATHGENRRTGEGSVGRVFGKVTLPDVTTATSAGSVTRTSAVVSGTVNPDETSVTSCEFEYGPTAAYGQSVPCSQSLPLSGSGPVAVSAEITGITLPAAALVHYRLKAANAKGANVGNDETFNTEPFSPPVLTALEASGVTQFGATLNGSIATSGGLVDYHFEYGTSTAYGQLAPVPDGYTPITSEPVAVSQGIGGLQAGTAYHYRLVANGPGGSDVAGPDRTFTTSPVPAPLVSTGAASGVTRGEASLSGVVDPRGWGTSYRFEYGTSAAYGSSWPTVDTSLGAFTEAQAVTVTVENLQPGTTYHYRIVASNGGGISYGPDMTFTTAEYPVSTIALAPLMTGLSIAFPTEPSVIKKATVRKLTNAQKLAGALKACAKQARKRRAACKRRARKRYASVGKQTTRKA